VELTGSYSLTERIRELKPRLAVYGHIHEGRGEYRLGETILANVSILDVKMRHVHPVWMRDLDVRRPTRADG
jgi:Icc-related predicted phosphoesterase